MARAGPSFARNRWGVKADYEKPIRIATTMVVMQMPDGTTRKYDLRASESGLRLVRACSSYDLLAMVRDAGWRIHAVTDEADRIRLVRQLGRVAIWSPYVVH